MKRNNQRIDAEAAEWAVRAKLRVLTAEERTALDYWLAADPRHRGALLRASAAWLDLDRLAALAGHRPVHEGTPPAGAQDPAEDDEQPDSHPMVKPQSRPMHSLPRRLALAASFAAAALGGALILWAHSQRNVYVSEAGQVRQVSLSDGSRMVLNTATQATVQYDKGRREIELAKGEGLFQVVKDPARPFIVRAGAVTVRAVGTVFAVRTANHQVDVTVSQGVVELVDNSNPDHVLRRRVAANEHATVVETRQVEVQHLAEAEVAKRLAWREGLLDFQGQLLGDAVTELNRHNQLQIVVDDPQLAARPVVGQFLANDPKGFAATIAVAFGAQSVEKDEAIHLSQAAGR